MKIKQISFSQDYAKTIAKSNRQNSKRSIIHSSSLSHTKPNSPPFISHSNKRLKFYSKRQKDSVSSIDNINLEALKEEFVKFDDFRMKSFSKINFTHKKEAIKLIAKKYHTICKTQSIDEITHPNAQNKKTCSKPNQLVNLSQTIAFGDDRLRNSDQVKIINAGQLTQMDFDKKLIQFLDADLTAQNIDQNPQMNLKESLDNKRKFSVSSSKSNNRKILVPQERLNRHRFTKSSISKITYQNEQRPAEKKVDNFLSIDLSSPSKQERTYFSLDKDVKVERKQSNTIAKIKTSKRYVTANEEKSKPFTSINPYTKKRYLHVQVQVEKRQLKKIQKLIQQSDPTDMRRSFQVKHINPEMNIIQTSRTLNKTYRDGFMKKVKNLGASSVRKQFKDTNFKNKNSDLNQIHGWEIDSKQIIVDQSGQI